MTVWWVVLQHTCLETLSCEMLGSLLKKLISADQETPRNWTDSLEWQRQHLKDNV